MNRGTLAGFFCPRATRGSRTAAHASHRAVLAEAKSANGSLMGENGGAIEAHRSTTDVLPGATAGRTKGLVELAMRAMPSARAHGTKGRSTRGRATVAACALVVATLVCRGAHAQFCQTITLRSGQVGGAPGNPTQPDSNVRVHPLTPAASTSTFSTSVFTPAFLAQAQAGAPATVIAPFGSWSAQSVFAQQCDPLARWINPNSPATAATATSTVYAIPFTITTANIAQAQLTLCWAVDDRIGDANTPLPVNLGGVYVNGLPTTPLMTNVQSGGFQLVSNATSTITTLVTPGVNWLYIYQRNTGSAASGIIFNARIDVTCGCAPPPQNMVCWMPFDEAGGTGLLHSPTLNLLSNDGTLWGAAFLGQAGVVNGAVRFDGGRVDVPHYPAITLGGDFTLDAWVYPTGGSVPPMTWTLVDKRQFLSPTSWRGFRWFLDPSLLRATLELSAGATPVSVSSAPNTVSLNAWNFLAATVRRTSTPGQFQVSLYQTPRFAPLSAPLVSQTLSLSGLRHSTAPLRIGASFPDGLDRIFGRVDEFEIFSRALAVQELNAIASADAAGKCSESCMGGWNSLLYDGATSVQVAATVCNNTSALSTYQLSFGPAACATGNIPSPVGITAQPNPVPVNPGNCASVTLTIPRPPFLTQGDVSCYAMSIQNLATNAMRSCGGSIQWSTSISVGSNGNAAALWQTATPVTWGPLVVANNTGAARVLPYRFRVIGPNGGPDSSSVSLNGLAPGTWPMGGLEIPANGSRVLSVNGQFLLDDPLQRYALLLELDVDNDGSYRLAETFEFMNRLEEACPADLDSDGNFPNGGTPDAGVTIDDLLYFLAAFEAGDLSGDLDDGNGQGIPDGGVDINDLLFFLAHFEMGC